MTDTPTDVLRAIRANPPLVQCITNYVAMNVAANVLLAVGASPAMLHAPEESGDFAQVVSALTVNIGTLSPYWVDGMKAAIAGAQAAGKPWVLDPVAHYASPWRGEVARELLGLRPTVLRGNASEILALAGGSSVAKGADAGDPVEAAEAGARDLATRTGSVVAVTGEVDFVTHGKRAVRITGGSEWMPCVTALGCSLTCLVGAGVAVADAFDGTVAALAIFAAAGEEAAKLAEGPGSFGWRFLDALSALQPDAIGDRVSTA
jgi:hydroxyethylthiazole kinase